MTVSRRPSVLVVSSLAARTATVAVVLCVMLVAPNAYAAYNVRIVSAGSSSGGAWVGDVWIPSAAGSTVLASEIETHLQSGPTTITTAGPGSQEGNIVVQASISWSQHILTLSAAHDITINAALNGTGSAALVLEYGQDELAEGNTGRYRIHAFVSLRSNPDDPTGTPNFTTKRGLDGTPKPRAVPLCPVLRGGEVIRIGCSFLENSDLTALDIKYGAIQINAMPDTEIWIHVDGRNLLGQSLLTHPYNPYVMSCQPGKGTLYYPQNINQQNFIDADGHITDFERIRSATITTRNCKDWADGPVLSLTSLFSPDAFPYGRYFRFIPNAGDTGAAYQILTVLFAQEREANTGYLAIDYVINLLPVLPQPQGYWKTDQSEWPVATLTLGGQTYSQFELLDLLGLPKTSDASLILAAQLIAAKLNVANGVAAPETVQAAIASADAILAGYSGKLPYRVKPSSATGRTMTSLASILESFNEGR